MPLKKVSGQIQSGKLKAEGFKRRYFLPLFLASSVFPPPDFNYTHGECEAGLSNFLFMECGLF